MQVLFGFLARSERDKSLPIKMTWAGLMRRLLIGGRDPVDVYLYCTCHPSTFSSADCESAFTQIRSYLVTWEGAIHAQRLQRCETETARGSGTGSGSGRGVETRTTDDPVTVRGRETNATNSVMLMTTMRGGRDEEQGASLQTEMGSPHGIVSTEVAAVKTTRRSMCGHLFDPVCY